MRKSRQQIESEDPGCAAVTTVGPEFAAREIVPSEAVRDDAKVVGLGAPISVLLRLEPCEAPLLRARVHAKILEHDSKRPADAPTPWSEAEEWGAQRATLEDMLIGLDDDTATPIEVLWPTAYAYPVLYGALTDAVASVQQQRTEPDALPALISALDAARAILATWIAFDGVDGGGLQDVHL
jgi:hypothetical protein